MKFIKSFELFESNSLESDIEIMNDIISDISDEFGDTDITTERGYVLLDLNGKEGINNFNANDFERTSGYYLRKIGPSDVFQVRVKSDLYWIDIISIHFYRLESLSNEDYTKFENDLMGIRPQLKANGYDIVSIKIVKKAIYIEVCKIDKLEGLLNYFKIDEIKISVVGEDIELGRIQFPGMVKLNKKIPLLD
jgi:hypothetical protein